jgi:dTDP-4-dehydrorhamnose 3,5-epimerase-like enzyme
MNIKVTNFKKRGDENGWLTPVEENKDIPFEIKRVYYIYDTKGGVVRGKHAHVDLDQVLICVSGSCKIRLDSGMEKEIVELNNPNKGLFIGEKIWHDMHDFSEKCVLLVLASGLYDEKKYIRNYEEFLKIVKNG